MGESAATQVLRGRDLIIRDSDSGMLSMPRGGSG